MTTAPTRPHPHHGPHGRNGAGIRQRITTTDHALLAARLTDRDKWILAMLAEHRVLTTTHLALLAFPSLRSAQQRLGELYQLGAIARFQPLTPIGSAPLHWVIDTPGAAVITAQHPQPETPPRQSRSASRHRTRRAHSLAVAHSNQLHHLLGVNTCLASLAAHSNAHTSAQAGTDTHNRRGEIVGLGLWWSQARCAAAFGDHVRPDAYAHWHAPTPRGVGGSGRAESTDSLAVALADALRATQISRMSRVSEGSVVMPFFLEYDTGSEPATQLAGKLAGYHQLAAATSYATPVLIWLPSETREHHAREALAKAHAALPEPALVPVATTHTPLDPTRPTPAASRQPGRHAPVGPSGLGLAGPAWLPVPTNSLPPPFSGRLTLTDLAQHWSSPCGHNHANRTAHTAKHSPGLPAHAPHPVPPPAAHHPADPAHRR